MPRALPGVKNSALALARGAGRGQVAAPRWWSRPLTRPAYTALGDYLERQRRRVDAALEKFLPAERETPAAVHRAMRYSVFAGGKRLRPILCLAAAEACGAPPDRVMPAACALELIHTYSLIHDDLPAMDDDDFRRGRPTSHRVFGEGIAILAGDALLTQGFELLARNARKPGMRPAAALAAVEAVARGAGSLGMVGGQTVDLEMEGAGFEFRVSGAESRKDTLSAKGSLKSSASRPPLRASRKTLDYIHRHKTGALIRASLRAGALLAGAGPARLRALDAYGESIGLAFQIADDVLDIVGDKKLLGKRGSDRDNRKLTFPALYGLEASRGMARREVEKAKRAVRIFGPRGRVFRDLADYVIQRQK